jgi:hypothetical protein
VLINPNIVCISLDQGHQADQVVNKYPEYFDPKDRIKGPSAAVRALLASLKEEEESAVGAGAADDVYTTATNTATPATTTMMMTTGANRTTTNTVAGGGGGGGGGRRRERNGADLDGIFASSAGIFYGLKPPSGPTP